MKAAIVSSGAIRRSRYGCNLLAGHYLGQIEGRDAKERVEYYRAKVNSTIVKLSEAVDDLATAAARTKLLIDRGEMIPWEST